MKEQALTSQVMALYFVGRLSVIVLKPLVLVMSRSSLPDVVGVVVEVETVSLPTS